MKANELQINSFLQAPPPWQVSPTSHSMLNRKINGKEPTVTELRGMILKNQIK